MKTLRLILGDQLNPQHSWFESVDPEVYYVMMEVRQETDYVRHHIQKVVGFFAAMRHFAGWLRASGHQIQYLRLDDPANRQNIPDNLMQVLDTLAPDRFQYQAPDEYRLDQQLRSLGERWALPVEMVDTEHFLSGRGEVQALFEGKKQYLMERFYREMRRKYDLLMEGDAPLSGRWNYDAENRKKLPKNADVPEPLTFSHDVRKLKRMVIGAGISTIGTLDPAHFIWPVSREEALELLDFFLRNCLPHFGTYQDAMSEPYWSLYHARLSFSLNTKMLSPLEVVQAAIHTWEKDPENIGLAQVEGFVRQIIGWREYMRGIYWAHMPGFRDLNYFKHQRPLPDFYWTGETKMRCLGHAIRQSLMYAYAHHIQRLMVTGNFALLAGIDPDEVDAWYLGIYIDAIEWVEITNTRGMSQFADGGLVGTKPYVSSANYLDKMSDYCQGCAYDKKKRTGEGACPFNSLYWHFYHRHRPLLEANPRIGMMYRIWDKMEAETREAILQQAEAYLANLDAL